MTAFHVDLSTNETTELFKTSPKYRKNVTVTAVRLKSEQEIATVVNEDYVETVNTAYPGDYLITNPTGEKYILSPENFRNRYEHVEADTYRAKGVIVAAPNPYREEISITAPWGSPQYGQEDCYIAATLNPDGSISNDRYIIESKAFHATYIPA